MATIPYDADVKTEIVSNNPTIPIADHSNPNGTSDQTKSKHISKLQS